MLNQQEIDVLLKGLEALDASDAQAHIMNCMVGSMLANSEEEAKKRMDEMERRREQRQLAERAIRDDRVLLRAKLIQMRRECDSRDAERILSEAGR
jgi:hypothetical protein